MKVYIIHLLIYTSIGGILTIPFDSLSILEKVAIAVFIGFLFGFLNQIFRTLSEVVKVLSSEETNKEEIL